MLDFIYPKDKIKLMNWYKKKSHMIDVTEYISDNKNIKEFFDIADRWQHDKEFLKFIYNNNEIIIRCYTTDAAVFEQIFILKEYDGFNNVLFKNVNTIIDAGSNVGYSVVKFNSLFPNATIIAIEPDETNFKLLLNNTKNITKCIPFKTALWYKSEIVKVIDSGKGPWAYQVLNQNTETNKKVLSENILAISPNDFGSIIDIFKIDIEGSEKELFEGDTSWLDRTKCVIVETHERFKTGSNDAVLNKLNNWINYYYGENLFSLNPKYFEIINNKYIEK